jgi:hypothetical protein
MMTILYDSTTKSNSTRRGKVYVTIVVEVSWYIYTYTAVDVSTVAEVAFLKSLGMRNSKIAKRQRDGTSCIALSITNGTCIVSRAVLLMHTE